jgi:hypothetical protein
MIKGTARVMSGSAMATSISVITRLAKWTARDSILGSTVKATMANGAKDLNTGTVSGRVSMATNISVSGVIIKPTGTVSTSGKTVIAMKVSGTTVCAMVRARTSLQTVMFTWVSIATAKRKVTDSTDGQTAIRILARSRTE